MLGGQNADVDAEGGSDADPESDPEEDDGADEDLLGVEIEITPAGKAMKRLTLLSGGEKSMTALAFLFAVFLARPCPFYILDEVEAALDDLNIDRFLDLLDTYSAARPVHRRHPPAAHDGGRRLAVWSVDGRGWDLEGDLSAAARPRGRLKVQRSRRQVTLAATWPPSPRE